MEPMACPHCGKVNDAQTCITEPGASPEKGDVSLCFTCAGVAVFTGEGMTVRLPTDEEAAEFAADGRITGAQAMIRARL